MQLVPIEDVFINPEAVAIIGPYKGSWVGGARIPPNRGEDVEIRLVNGLTILTAGNVRDVAQLFGQVEPTLVKR